MPTATSIVTRIATLDDLHVLAPLFADYRAFYAQPYDADIAREFCASGSRTVSPRSFWRSTRTMRGPMR
ncbi:MAG: hypothetical protein IT473_09715 [Lysobacter sp.]|nr:hypothetical protein [Lysobacter sp.]